MTHEQLSQAVAIATSRESLENEDITMFDGFGLPGFEPVFCTIRQLARLVRWQAVNMDGTIDGDALNEIAQVGRRRFIVV